MKIKYALIVTALFMNGFVFAQASNPILGNWTLNYEESNIQAPKPQIDVRQYRMREDGFLVGLAVWVDAEGNPGFLQFTAKSDGEFYPEYNSSNLADFQATNKMTVSTYSESIVDTSTIMWTDKYQDIVTASGTKTFTDDGMKMAIEVNVKDSNGEMLSYILIYDKQ